MAVAVLDVDDHTLAVDIADLHPRYLVAPCARGVGGHQHDVIEGSGNGVNELGGFFLTENGGQVTHLLGIGVSVITQNLPTEILAGTLTAAREQIASADMANGLGDEKKEQVIT
jgi:hypothetical protein